MSTYRCRGCGKLSYTRDTRCQCLGGPNWYLESSRTSISDDSLSMATTNSMFQSIFSSGPSSNSSSSCDSSSSFSDGSSSSDSGGSCD